MQQLQDLINIGNHLSVNRKLLKTVSFCKRRQKLCRQCSINIRRTEIGSYVRELTPGVLFKNAVAVLPCRGRGCCWLLAPHPDQIFQQQTKQYLLRSALSQRKAIFTFYPIDKDGSLKKTGHKIVDPLSMILFFVALRLFHFYVDCISIVSVVSGTLATGIWLFRHCLQLRFH